MRDKVIYSHKQVFDIQKLKHLDEILINNGLDRERIRVMPNFCVMPNYINGLTIHTKLTVPPALIGSDIGCGILYVELGNIDVDTSVLDEIIKKFVPYGRNVHEKSIVSFDFESDRPYKRFERCLGTLGGGDHFISLDTDENNNKYLLIHSGSRGYGMMVSHCFKYNEYYTEKLRDKDYYKNIRICLRFAKTNREQIARLILSEMNLKPKKYIDIPHNYIDTSMGILRKSAILAKEDEDIVIFYKGGSLIGKGLGNSAYNYSAPAYKTDDRQTLDDFIEMLDETVKINSVLKNIYYFRPE